MTVITDIETHPVLRADNPKLNDFARGLLLLFCHIVECFGCGNDCWVATKLVALFEARGVRLVYMCSTCCPSET